jgi:nucleoside-diphosphate-sugar epimerase
MVKVAIAGGSGGVGRTIVEALKDQKTHEFIILSRKVGLLIPSFDMFLIQSRTIRSWKLRLEQR